MRTSALRSAAATDSCQPASSSSALASCPGSSSRRRLASFASAIGWSGPPPPNIFSIFTPSSEIVACRSGTIRRQMAALIAKDSKELAPGYRTLHLVGQGGQAQVWLAERVHDGKLLALKVLDRSLRQDAVFLERFVREYKLLASIEHENIVRIYDQGFSGDHPYIAMEFLPGGTLASRTREGITSRDALKIISEIARALEPIHARGII